jgi:hypothetical protein
MKCLYYLAPNLESTHRIADELQGVIRHVISRDERGLKLRDIPSSNYLETLDVLGDGFTGAAIGVLAGLAGAALLRLLDAFGPNAPGYLYPAIIVLGLLFGAWEGGLTGIATEHRKLASFHHDIEAGRYLILVYTPKEREAGVRRMMRARHPEAPLAAIDPHFINPFSPVARRKD